MSNWHLRCSRALVDYVHVTLGSSSCIDSIQLSRLLRDFDKLFLVVRIIMRVFPSMLLGCRLLGLVLEAFIFVLVCVIVMLNWRYFLFYGLILRLAHIWFPPFVDLWLFDDILLRFPLVSLLLLLRDSSSSGRLSDGVLLFDLGYSFLILFRFCQLILVNDRWLTRVCKVNWTLIRSGFLWLSFFS